MVAHAFTVAFEGMKVRVIDVQVHFANGLPGIKIVGLPSKVVDESKERVRAAMSSIGLSLPNKRITVNLSPANCIKNGSHYDLPIFLAIIAEMNVIDREALTDYIVIGEVSLDGFLVNVNGVLPAALEAKARQKALICPFVNGGEAKFSKLEQIVAVNNLLEMISYMQGQFHLKEIEGFKYIDESEKNDKFIDFKDIRGQPFAKRALEIAAAGGHNVLMIGSPGVGKSMLANAFHGIVPDLEIDNLLENNIIQSLYGNLTGEISKKVPFRNPHHSCSMQAMIGGGRAAKPGEITLAHNGILFLDEFPEFPRTVLESLRQSLENGEISIARVENHVTYPADFQLIAAMNPCRCGYAYDKNRSCKKLPFCQQEYMNKISGPLLDRIDMVIHVHSEPILIPNDNETVTEQPSSAEIKTKITTLREKQRQRLQNIDEKFVTNTRLSTKLLEKIAPLDQKCTSFLNQIIQKQNLSIRSQNKIIKIARTIADSKNEEKIHLNHLMEAMNYRNDPEFV